MPAQTEVKLELEVPLPIVLVSVDGKPKQPFILDTGAGVTVVSCGETPTGPTTLSTLAFGGMVFRDVAAQCAAIPKGLGAEGILSPQDAFRGALVELDGRALAVRLYRDLDQAGWRSLLAEPVHAVPLAWSDGLATVETRIGESSTLAMRLDSGAGGCGLPRAELDRLGHVGKDEVTLALAVGDSRPGREQVFLLDGPGSLGFPWFIGRRAALSADRKTLLFTDRR
ncbi:MAG TPA: hypothetical protein VGK67_08140 [Myxococcales bacterium]|jgi:hypothetical protein